MSCLCFDLSGQMWVFLRSLTLHTCYTPNEYTFALDAWAVARVAAHLSSIVVEVRHKQLY